MEIIVELLFELLGEVLIEVFFRLTGRTILAMSRPALGLDEPSRWWKVGGWSVVTVVSGAAGWLRGISAAHHPRWGLWLAIAVAGVGLVRLATSPTSPRLMAGDQTSPLAVLADEARRPFPARPRGLRATFTWWPRERVAFFVVANAAFAVAYLLAAALASPSALR